MLRQKALHFDKDSHSSSNFVFSTDHVEFCETGANVTFHGIKNDSTRTGFTVVLQPMDNEKLDPVKALQDYIVRTSDQRPDGNPVFLSLTSPIKAISTSTGRFINFPAFSCVLLLRKRVDENTQTSFAIHAWREFTHFPLCYLFIYNYVVRIILTEEVVE